MYNNSIIPETGFVRLSTILKVYPVSAAHWWRQVQTGKVPAPVRLSKKITVWKAEDIRQLIKSAGESND